MTSPSTLPVIGALLAGGESRRFGSPKALARLHGVTLADRVRQIIEAAGLRPLLVEREEGGLGPAMGLESVVDAKPARGPLSGLVAALRVAQSKGLSGVVAVGVDQPLLPPELLRWIATLGVQGAKAVAIDGPRHLQPLGAFYATSSLLVAESHLASGNDVSLQGLLESLPTRRVPLSELARFGDAHQLFLNINTPADLERAARSLGDPKPVNQAQAVPAGLPPVFCVVGWKNSGKTGFVVELVQELKRRGLNVMTAKHGHGFDLDRPGTDSWRHLHEGGARRVALVGPENGAVLGVWDAGGEPTLAETVSRYLGDADVVIAEGFKSAPFPKIEVFAGEPGAQSIAAGAGEGGADFMAVVSDVQPGIGEVPTLLREGAAARIADLIQERIAGMGG